MELWKVCGFIYCSPLFLAWDSDNLFIIIRLKLHYWRRRRKWHSVSACVMKLLNVNQCSGSALLLEILEKSRNWKVVFKGALKPLKMGNIAKLLEHSSNLMKLTCCFLLSGLKCGYFLKIATGNIRKHQKYLQK